MDRREAEQPSRPQARQGGQGKTDKTPVVALVSRETGEVRSRAVANVRGSSLRRVIGEEVDPGTTHLHTDAALSYVNIARDFAGHSTVDHRTVRDGVTTDQAENFFSQLKRSIDGTPPSRQP